MSTVFYFCLGSIIASFACCCGYRLGKGQAPWSPRRSYCDNCGHLLTSWQLIPILGWLLQGGHCHYCGNRISVFLPTTELFIGIAAALLCNGSSYPLQLVYLLVLTTLTVLACCDFFYCFIYPIFILGLLPLAFSHNLSWSITEFCSTLFLLMIVFILVAKYQGLGSGDLYFLIMTLIVLGFYPTVAIILLASASTLLLIPFSNIKVPFIPGLAFATIIVLIYLKQKGALA